MKSEPRLIGSHRKVNVFSDLKANFPLSAPPGLPAPSQNRRCGERLELLLQCMFQLDWSLSSSIAQLTFPHPSKKHELDSTRSCSGKRSSEWVSLALHLYVGESRFGINSTSRDRTPGEDSHSGNCLVFPTLPLSESFTRVKEETTFSRVQGSGYMALKDLLLTKINSTRILKVLSRDL